MRSVTSAALLGLFATMTRAADNSSSTPAIVTGDGAKDLSAKTWAQVIDSPTNSSSARFTGFDLTKAYPGAEQPGWRLEAATKGGLPGDLTATVMALAAPDGVKLDRVDGSWHLCVYAFSVKPTSASGWGSGKKESCKGLVADECVRHLRQDALGKYAPGECPDYSTTAACLRDLEEQTSLSLSLSAKDIPSAVSGNATFFRRADGKGAKAFSAAAGQPMVVLTVWGPSGSSDKAPTAEEACVMPNAQEASSAASTSAAASFAGWSVVVLAVALQLVL